MNHEAYEIIGADRPSRWLVGCDHASNAVPKEVRGGTLGLDPAEMARHIAWDVGASGVARALSEELHAPAILSRFSRLVIDPNRGEDDPTLIMKVYDRTIVPGNRTISDAERQQRLERYYTPYHRAFARLAARQARTLIVTVHSFTPRLNGRSPRPWHVGILYDPREADLSLALLDRLRAEGDLCVGENQPYAGHLPGDTIDRHGIGPSRANTLIELRSDLIETPEAQIRWARRLAPLLEAAREDAGV